MMKLIPPQFLVLIFITVSIGQSVGTRSEAFLLDSFGLLSSGELRGRFDVFLSKLAGHGKGTRGVIVNYGSVPQVEARKRFSSNHFHFRRFDTSLISYVRGGNVSTFRTDLWIVPAGASPPRIKPEALVAAEFGRVTRTRARAVIKKFFDELVKEPDHQGYIIVYGTTAQMTMQEKWVIDVPRPRVSDRSRITIVRGGKRKQGIGTVMWAIPPGAAHPTP